MSEDALAALVGGYLLGCMVTLFSIDAPSRTGFVERRIFLWPLYWAYLLVKMAFMLAHELRR
jgi:hypothetical protein